MKTIIANFEVNHNNRESFIIHTYLMKANTLLELGCVKYDIFVNERNNCEFTFIEVFENNEAFEFHKNSEHFKKWKELTHEMIFSKDVKFIKKL